MIRGITL